VPSIADLAVVTCLRLLNVDPNFVMPTGTKNYIHHVRNFITYLDKVDSGDGKLGLDQLVEMTNQGKALDLLHLTEDRDKHAKKDDIMDDA
jgi:hypothetical protein